ncbi:hypothetical protein BN7_742 [Wickerhamomyces ciferrii]|uniref:Uncharacterized protein n=1 Tax=Wickerhamomyces ciferrii (strain ATCC 14091 / BCRC 22168 / CBS 111 / JCM 3599 / NBRC 0793 / NRRL Y-1031 F-60-10) TaxID=1206466 RepID=K0K8N9_WICCF|nr:uncharacterized protein BN7_742 [Wickerhamomyces ciferrii]CCH41205.1 hypothetical protein BN7_742 [Wickerhamomyces ciferrii]
MAVAVLPQSLSQDVLNDNHKYDVPKDVYEEQLLPILQALLKFGITDPSTVKFDPAKHILFTDDYYTKTKRHTLEELGLKNLHQTPISPIGVSEPFPLFTQEAITIMRYELIQKDLIEHCGRVSSQSTTGDVDLTIRGYTKKFAHFTHEAWTHPKTMEIINKMAGVELLHMFDYEIASANVSIRSEATKLIDQTPIDYDDPDKIPGIVSWHFDSPQFVCVLMMSDTTKMVGGETSLIKGDGKVAKVANPKQGWANVLQGRVVKHIAPKPSGEYDERITQVCSYRPADPMLDKCVMTTIKPAALSGTRYNEFYKDWMNYRLEVLSKRVDILKEQINTKIDKGERFDQIETINFIQKNIVEYAEHTWQEFEVVDDGIVEKPASYQVTKARWD